MKQQAKKVKGITVRVIDTSVQRWLEEKTDREYVSLNALLNRILHQAMNADEAKISGIHQIAA